MTHSSIYLLEPGSAQKSVIETSEAFVIVKSIQVIVYICQSVKLSSSLFKLSYTSASQVKLSQGNRIWKDSPTNTR
ncbi:hypothetical protein D9615_009518 [Tricholomella constricta]|uniref:Uncharacterized protein n=1 Tax=Tricholomella constricta TaxID=117010 RepID=A0A8H5GYF6_9AGAR|nr:hypothetical protein D9615_009518 [Tricholomella constricta]